MSEEPAQGLFAVQQGRGPGKGGLELQTGKGNRGSGDFIVQKRRGGSYRTIGGTHAGLFCNSVMAVLGPGFVAGLQSGWV